MSFMEDGISLGFGNDVVGEGFKPVPEGTYRLRIIQALVADSKSTAGNKNLELHFKIIDNPEFENKELRDWTSLSVAARWRLRDVLEAITKQPWRDDDMKLRPKELIGMTVMGNVTTVPRRDNPQQLTNNIAGYQPDFGDTVPPQAPVASPPGQFI